MKQQAEWLHAETYKNCQASIWCAQEVPLGTRTDMTNKYIAFTSIEIEALRKIPKCVQIMMPGPRTQIMLSAILRQSAHEYGTNLGHNLESSAARRSF